LPCSNGWRQPIRSLSSACKQRLADLVADQRLHFPVADWCHEEFFAQLTAETSTPIFNPAGVRVGQRWEKQRVRNEILDLMVLNLVGRQIRGTLDLDRYRRQVGIEKGPHAHGMG
jgi:phage terminase large subunit GpA-like protein